jgi:hypothetical protein
MAVAYTLGRMGLAMETAADCGSEIPSGPPPVFTNETVSAVEPTRTRRVFEPHHLAQSPSPETGGRGSARVAKGWKAWSYAGPVRTDTAMERAPCLAKLLAVGLPLDRLHVLLVEERRIGEPPGLLDLPIREQRGALVVT